MSVKFNKKTADMVQLVVRLGGGGGQG